jgi:hypothetical protein
VSQGRSSGDHVIEPYQRLHLQFSRWPWTRLGHGLDAERQKASSLPLSFRPGCRHQSEFQPSGLSSSSLIEHGGRAKQIACPGPRRISTLPWCYEYCFVTESKSHEEVFVAAVNARCGNPSEMNGAAAFLESRCDGKLVVCGKPAPGYLTTGLSTSRPSAYCQEGRTPRCSSASDHLD